ncbi:MAG: hypothetical protein OHK0039_35590 [Bacteroidia bacterium]
MSGRTLESVQKVAQGFGELLDRVIFVGSAVMRLYVTSGAAPESRPTEDIDCLIDARSRLDLFTWEQELLKRGFHKRDPQQSPTAHWRYGDIRLKIAPIQQAGLLGYTNRWFEEGAFHARTAHLPNGLRIRIFEPAYYFAAKLEAFDQRGGDDFRLSEDFEDIIYLLDNRPELAQDLTRAFYEVRNYIRKQLRDFLADPELEEGIYYAMPFDTEPEQVHRIIRNMRDIAAYEPSLVR